MAETSTTQAANTTTPAAEAATQEASTQAAPAAEQHADKPSDLEKVIQQAVDRATNKLGNENKKLRGEIEKLQKANMDADELKKFELSEKEKEIADREKALLEKENRLYAIKAVKEIGLDVGLDADTSLAVVDLVMADDEDGISARVKTLDALVKHLVKTQVGDVFKANGRTPGVGSDSAANAGGQDSFGAQMGKRTATVNQKSQSVLDLYINGGKKA